MSKITELLDTLDFSKLVPDLESILGKVQPIATFAVLLGPLILLALGLMYLFKPPKEANHKAGFRTYFGMGSVEAWKFTQRIAGFVLGGLGLILTVIMIVICVGFGDKELMQVMETATKCLIWEAILTFLAWLGICLFITVMYDERGRRRK